MNCSIKSLSFALLSVAAVCLPQGFANAQAVAKASTEKLPVGVVVETEPKTTEAIDDEDAARLDKKSDSTKAAKATEDPKTDDAEDRIYVRVTKTERKKSKALQTATASYVGKPGTQYDGCTVDLVGVVHIGEAEYYSKLKKQLAGYDKVLYELVAPNGTRIRPEDLQGQRSVLASMQTGMKDMLNLEYQLEKIDYMAKNFRHADMSPEEYRRDQERRGDSTWKMVARMTGAGLASQGGGGDLGMLFAMFSSNRAKLMKRSMARQMVDMEKITSGMDDENGENTIIKGRNTKAFKILKDELDKGSKTVAVFYGAGHLSDMADRLESEFEMQHAKTTWLDAWDLTRN